MKARLERVKWTASCGTVRLLGISWDGLGRLRLGAWLGTLTFFFLQRPRCQMCGAPAEVRCSRSEARFRDYFCTAHGGSPQGPCHLTDENRQHHPIDANDYYYEE